MPRTMSHPVLLSGESGAQPATPIHFDADKASGDRFDENWLQHLIHTNPAIMPVEQVEPAFDTLIPVCRELPTPSGFLDNLFVTPTGYLVLAECKLWRNPESRRKVVAQILDYGKDLAGWGYDDLAKAINKANRTDAANPLYDAVKDQPDALPEAAFHDRIVRGLRTGRYLLLIVGDGIQEGVEDLTAYIQQHMGLHFTLALVEMKLYRLPQGLLVVPYVIAKTENVERAVLRVETSAITVATPAAPVQIRPTTPKKLDTLTEGDFFDVLDANHPGMAAWLRSFLLRCEELGISYDIRKWLILKWSPDGETLFQLAAIEPSGRVWTTYANYRPNALGRLDVAHAFQQQLAEVVGGTVRMPATPKEWHIRTVKGTLTLADIRPHEEAVLGVFRGYLESLRGVAEG